MENHLLGRSCLQSAHPQREEGVVLYFLGHIKYLRYIIFLYLSHRQCHPLQLFRPQLSQDLHDPKLGEFFLFFALPFISFGPQEKNHNEKQSPLNIFTAIEKGSSFLKENQNEDGSWGSPHQTKGLNIFAPVPGSHRAFRLAVSALSLNALLHIQSNNPEYKNTISKARDYLLKNLGLNSCVIPNISCNTRTCPSTLAPAPIPITGIVILLAIF